MHSNETRYQSVEGTERRNKSEKWYSVVVIVISLMVMGYTTYVLKSHLDKDKEIRSLNDKIKAALSRPKQPVEVLKEADIVAMAKNTTLKACFIKDDFIEAIRRLKHSDDGANEVDETMLTVWRHMERPKILLQRNAKGGDVKTFGEGENFIKIKQWVIANGKEVHRECMNDFFQVHSNGTLVVKQPGRYFVTSQVVFKCSERSEDAGLHIHKVTCNDPDMSKAYPLMINAYQLCGKENSAHEVSLQGGVYRLAADSSLTVELKMPRTSYIDHVHHKIQVDSTTLTLAYLAYDESLVDV